ncbi:DNA polymerase III subunit delta [Corynebacterium lizhenjunii]|uniref:DNA polymerase III subunit delta n=1 Tax=Corynebacterium lizhenjunii TaxID=2709394 RepID=UPI0013EAB744|nr:DNA polymerase III subunit delta [Corynebacterium lizhenjunii]
MTAAPVHLIVGDDEFLAERARLAIQRAQGTETLTLRASEVTQGELIEATSPSLFGEDRVIVITDAEKVGAELGKVIIAACADPAPGMTLVVMYSVTAKTMKSKKKPPELVAKLSSLGQVHEVYALGPRELNPWLTHEFQQLGVRPTPDVIQLIIDSVGSDLRELASAASQLVADTDGNVTRDAVRDYYSGIAEVANWDIADAAVAGRTGAAVATCRRALQLGASPVAIAFALANKVSTIARLYDARGDHFTLAKNLGMNPYAVKASLPVARRWSGDNVTAATILVDNLGASVVGQGGDEAYAVEEAVRQIAQLAG